MWFLSNLLYSDHVAYISFIFIRLSSLYLLPLPWNPSRYLVFRVKIFHSGPSVFKCQHQQKQQRQQQGELDDTLKETKSVRRQKEKCHIRKVFKTQDNKKKRRSDSKFFGHKIIMLSCRWWRIVCPTLPFWEGAASGEGRKKFLVILDIIYWFIIINENETWSKVFYIVSRLGLL